MKKFQLFFYSFFHLIILITQFSSVFSLNCPTKQEIEILLKTNIHIFESFVVPLNETGRSIKPILDEKQNSICQTEINQIPTRSPLNYRKNQALNLYNKTNSTFSIATFNSQLNCYSIADNQNGIKCLDSKISETISLCDFLPLMLIDKQSNEFQWINKFQTMESNIKTFSEDLTSKCQLIQSKNQIEMEIANLTIQNENETIKIILMNLENQVDSLNQQIDFLQNELMGQLMSIWQIVITQIIPKENVTNRISFLIDEWQKANVSPFPNSSFENSQLSFNQLQNWFNNLTELLQGINAKEHESLFPFFKNNSDLFINSTMERLQMLNLSIPEKDLIYLETETALSVVSFHLFLATFNALGVSIQNGVNTENYTDFRDRIDGIQEILDSVEQIFQKLQSKNCSCLSTKISELQLINFKITDNDEAIYENNTNKGKIYESKLTGIFSCKLIEEMQQNKQVSFDFDTIYPMKIIDKIEVGRVCDDDSTITILVPYNSYPTNNTIIDLNKFDGNNRVFNLSKRIEQTLNSEEYPILTDQEQSKNFKKLKNLKDFKKDLKDFKKDVGDGNTCPPSFYMDSLTMTCRICPKSYYCPGDNMPHLCYNADSSQIEYINIGENSSECSFRCTMQGYYNNLNQNCSRNPIGKFSEDGINLLDCQTLIDNRFSYFTSPGLTNETSCNSTFIFQSISNESAKNISLIPGDFTIEIFAQLDSQLLEKYLEYFPEDGFVFGLVGVYDLWELTLYIQNDSQPILENLNASLRLELSFKNNSLEEEEHKIFAPKLILSSEIFQFDDKWHHYAVIGNSKEFILSFYKDGNPIGKIWYNQSELADPSQLSEQDQEKLFLYFGGIRFRSESNFYYPKTSHWFYGELDELNIFNQSIEINQLGYFTTSKFIKYSCIGRENLLIQKDDSQILCVPKSAENTESITNYENLKAFDPNKWNSSLNSEIIHYTSQCPEYYDFFNDQCMLSCKGGSIRDNFNVQNCKCGYDEYKIWGFPNDQYLTLVFSLQNTSFPIEISEIQFVDSKGVYLEIEDCYEDDPFPQCRVLFDNIKKKSKLTMSSSSSYNFGFANVWIVSGVEPKRVTFKFLNQNANISNIAIYSSSSSNNSLIGFFDFYLSDILPPANSTNWGTKITTKINPIYSGITELIDRNTTSSYSNLTYCQKCSGNSSSSILPRTSVLDCICNQGFVRLNEPTHKCLIGKSGNSEPKLSLPSGLYARGTQVYGIMDDFSSDSYLQLEMSRFSSNGTILQKVEYFYSNSDFLSLEGSMNISATVKQDGYFDSQKVLYVYEVKPQVCQPETYPNASDPNLILPTKLVLFSRTINASIFYTVDGTDPTFSSKIYSPNDNLTAYQNLVVSAIATKSGEFPSEIVRIKFVDKILLSSSSSQDQQQSSNHFGFLGGSSQKESFLLITLLCAISILLFLIVVIPLIFWMKEKKKRKKELVDQIEFEQLLLENTKGGEIELNENENENQNQNENQNEIKNLFSTDSKKTKESNIICDYCHQKDAVWRYPNPKNTRESLKFCGDCVDFFELYFDRLRLFCCDYCDENLAKTGKKELFFNQKTGLFSCDFCVGKQIADGFVDESDLFVVPVCDLCKKEEAVWFCSDCLDKKRFLCLDCECEAHICVFHSPEQITTWKNVKNEEIELSLENIQAK